MEAYKNLLEVVPALNIKTAKKFLQFLFIGLNLFYGVVGTLFIMMFVLVNWASDMYALFLGWDFFSFSIVFVIIGVIMFIFSLFGGIATVKESTLLTNVYAAVMLVVLVIEVNASITLFIMYGNVEPKVEMNMREHFHNETLQTDSYAMEMWNRMQLNLYCCGIDRASDWAPLHIHGVTVYDDGDYDDDRYNWRYTARVPRNAYTVPFSCCYSYKASKNQSEVYCDGLRSPGCLEALKWRLRDYLPIVAIIVGVTILTQLVGCIIAYVLAKVIRRSKTREEMKKQELQHLVYENLHQSQEDKEDLLNTPES